jgi:WYL domain
MRAMTGRAVSAAIHQRLREALAKGEPLTYQQLAEQAGCTVRSVRNYLARAQDIFGFTVAKSRDDEHRVVVRAVGLKSPRAPSVKKNDVDPFDEALASALFPDAAKPSRSRSSVIVAFQGLPAYGIHQTLAARRWANAPTGKSSTALRVVLCHDSAEVVLWPVAVVVHNLSGVVLVGAPPEAERPDQIVCIELASVRDEPDAIQEAPDASAPEFELDEVVVDDLLDLPFSALKPHPDEPMIDVHVRFEPMLATSLAHRIWHRSQRVVLRRNGELDVRFGPVPLGAAASWAAGFGAGVRIMGDKKLRKAIKKTSFVP